MQGCEAVQRPQKLTLSNRFQRFMHSSLLTSTAPFDMEYRVVYAEHRSPWQIQVEFLLDKIVRNYFWDVFSSKLVSRNTIINLFPLFIALLENSSHWPMYTNVLLK